MNQVMALLEKGETVKASIHLFGDPNPGHKKSLFVKVMCPIIDVPGVNREHYQESESGELSSFPKEHKSFVPGLDQIVIGVVT